MSDGLRIDTNHPEQYRSAGGRRVLSLGWVDHETYPIRALLDDGIEREYTADGRALLVASRVCADDLIRIPEDVRAELAALRSSLDSTRREIGFLREDRARVKDSRRFLWDHFCRIESAASYRYETADETLGRVRKAIEDYYDAARIRSRSLQGERTGGGAEVIVDERARQQEHIHDGIRYLAINAPVAGQCNGCHISHGSDHCKAAPSCSKHHRFDARDIIWHMIEPVRVSPSTGEERGGDRG